MFDVVAIGSSTRDNFLKGDFPLVDFPEAPSGKALVFPFGEKLEAKEVYFTIGGNAANASVTFARHGLKTACMGKIGNDLPGREFIAHLKKEKVETKYIAKTDERPTAYSVLLLKNGERTILGYHGASDKLELGDLPLNKLKSRWWYLSLAGESYKLYPELISFAKKNKINVAVNPSGYHIKHRKQDILSSLGGISLLVVNAGEAAELTGIPFQEEEKVFKKLDELTKGIVVVTDGPRGVMVSDGKILYKAGSFKEKEIVDRTGAGDAFGSGFVSVLAREAGYNKPDVIKEAIRFASANATSVVEHIGATEGVLTGKEFEKDPRWKDFKVTTQKLF